MDMDQAAVFLAGSILTGLGFLVWIFIALLVNNLIHKYWKSWGWNFHGFIPQQEPVRFMSDDEASKIAPTMDKK